MVSDGIHVCAAWHFYSQSVARARMKNSTVVCVRKQILPYTRPIHIYQILTHRNGLCHFELPLTSDHSENGRREMQRERQNHYKKKFVLRIVLFRSPYSIAHFYRWFIQFVLSLWKRSRLERKKLKSINELRPIFIRLNKKRQKIIIKTRLNIMCSLSFKELRLKFV